MRSQSTNVTVRQTDGRHARSISATCNIARSYNAKEANIDSTADLHNSIPIVASSDAEESKERHSKVAEVSVLAESFTVKSR